jgi:YqjK-like protein
VNRRLAQNHARRERLLGRSAVQRDELAALLTPLRGPLALADRAVAAARWARAHPEAVGLAAAILVVLSPRRALRWASRAFTVWRGYRLASRMLRTLAP